MDIFVQVQSGISFTNVAVNNTINKSFVNQWIQNKKAISDGSSNQHRKLFKKNKKSNKHETIFKKLHHKFTKFKKTKSAVFVAVCQNKCSS